MDGVKITITGSVPSKKNSKTFFVRNGRPMILPGKVYRQWHGQASAQLYGIKPIAKVTGIDIVIFAGDRRRGDLTNKSESVMDLLVDNGIIEDDNWYIVADVHLKFGGVDKENPRAEIYII